MDDPFEESAETPPRDPIAGPREHSGIESPPRAGAILALWMILTVLLQAALWVSGARATVLTGAVERGVERAESRVIGEVGDEVVRKAIALQRDTYPFWATIAALGDFAVGPLALAFRAAVAATLFAGLAMLRGRPVEFSRGLASCAWCQGYWVLGLAVRATLAIGLRRPEVETSAVLLLPPGVYPATVWAVLRELDAFALLGWWAIGRGAVRRGQVGWLGAAGICVSLFLIEATTRASFALLVGAGMRLSLLPET